ncbi:MAG: hypothetical protein IMW86_07640 [Hydrogenibacillus sp.]|nr:hypothetical protein [Hydrogenibacillus sp.]
MFDVFQSTYALLKLLSISPVAGRKRLQKTIHLLKSAGAPFSYAFRYHHYGPYAHALQEEIDQLVAGGLVEEQLDHDGYVYRLTERGVAFLARLESDGYRFPLDETLYRSLIREQASFLEVVSTYAYFRTLGLTAQEAMDKVRALKPSLADLIPQAVRYYDECIGVKRSGERRSGEHRRDG